MAGIATRRLLGQAPCGIAQQSGPKGSVSLELWLNINHYVVEFQPLTTPHKGEKHGSTKNRPLYVDFFFISNDNIIKIQG